MNKNALAIRFIQENPGFSKKKLGEMMSARYPDIWPTPEVGRSAVRTATGTQGKHTKKYMKQQTTLTLPKPEKNDYSKVTITQKRIGILSDIHFPYYDESALDASINYLVKFNPDCIVLNGDTVDMYHASNFEKDPKERDLAYEFDMVREFLKQLHSIFPKARIIYKLGNHDERYERNVLQHVPHFLSLQWMTFDFALNFEMPFKVEVVKNKRLIKAGHLNIAHGHEFAKGFIAPVNVARGFYLRAKANVIAGHHHRISEHLETDINGKLVGAWSTGCLCELNPKYMPINSWQHGFATVELDGYEFMVENKRILNGKVL